MKKNNISILALAFCLSNNYLGFSQNKKDLKLRVDSFTIALDVSKNKILNLEKEIIENNNKINNRDSVILTLKQSLIEIRKEHSTDSIKTAESIVFSNFTDKRDGKSYKTVKLGNQIWMAEDLNYNMDDDGSYFYPDRMLKANDNEIQEALRFYSISPEKIKDKKEMNLLKAFNPLLELFELRYPNGWRYYTSLNAAKKACPEGWRLPNNKDLENLNKYFKSLDFLLFGLDVAWWKKTYNNPIMEIRLGDYLGAAMYWSGTEIPGSFCVLELGSDGFKLNVSKIWEDHEEDLGFTIRCVKDVTE